MEDLLKKLTQRVETTTELASLEAEISLLSTNIFRSHTDSLESLFTKSISSRYASELVDALKSKTLGLTPEEVARNLASLSGSLKDYFNEVNVTLAFDPPPALITKITAWLRKAHGTNLLTHLQTDYRILGGMVVVINGKVIDLSLRKKLHDQFGSSLEKLTDSFS